MKYIMKYKKELGGLVLLSSFGGQILSSMDSIYTPTHAILVCIFAYLGIRLTYFVYFKNK